MAGKNKPASKPIATPNDQAPKKKGRPLLTLDFSKLDLILGIGADLDECAEFFDMDEDTVCAIIKREKGMLFSEYKDKKRARGRLNLRRQMEMSAQKGSVAMQIFLSKNILGYSDKVEQKHDVVVSPGLTQAERDVIAEDPEAQRLSRQLGMKLLEHRKGANDGTDSEGSSQG